MHEDCSVRKAGWLFQVHHATWHPNPKNIHNQFISPSSDPSSEIEEPGPQRVGEVNSGNVFMNELLRP
jgi:hypothetical protein